MDGHIGSVRGEDCSRQRESRMNSQSLSCSRFRWERVQFSLHENSDIAGITEVS